MRHLNETLELRVAERTRELELAHALVLAEMVEREQAEKELRESQKMEMLGKFTGGIAHDFNNLLMAVLSNLELLSKHFAQDAKAQRLISGAVRGAERGATLTQQLLAFARQQDLKVQPRDVVALVKSSEALLRHSVGDKIDLEFRLDDGVPLALVDESQLDLALLNLVVNARDAMPGGGVIAVGVDHVATDDDAQPGARGHVRLTVKDHGQGMDEKTLERATQPFFSTKELGKGTGLGLSMIHGLALQLGGKLVLSSGLGQGTTAELWLPVADGVPGTPVTEPTSLPAADDAPDRPLRVLFVDDDVLIAMSSADMLRDLGHDVTEVNSARQALTLLEAGENFNLMITDYSMPKMNGGQLAIAARELCPDLPILLATGYAELPHGTGLDLPRLGKPYAQRQLQVEIEALLKGT